MHVHGDGLQLICDAPASVAAGQPLRVVLIVVGCTGTPELDVALEVHNENVAEVDIRAVEREHDVNAPHAFLINVPGLADDEVAVLTFAARDGDRQVPRSEDGPATLAIRAQSVQRPHRLIEKSAIGTPLPLAELASSLDEPQVGPLLDRLSLHGMASTHDLLSRWGDDRLPDMDAEDEQIVGDLVAHALLATLPLTLPERRRLVAAGIRTPADLAVSAPQAVEALLPRADGVSGLLAAAAAQTSILSALETDHVVSSANGSTATEPDVAASPGECGCEDCRAATSPMAYLADLLSYATQRMSWAGDPITVADLGRLLRQPLADLPVDCSSTEEDLSQVRLVIESIEELLRRELRANPDVAVAPVSHRITFVVAADVDGDGRDELVLGFDEAWVTRGDPTRSGIWVMRYDSAAARWQHLRPGTDIRHAALLLPFGMHAASGFAARFRPDTAPLRAERTQVVIEVTTDNEPGGRYWVMQYEPSATTVHDAWTHVAPDVMAGFGVDLVLPVETVAGAFGADVDGDGLDEFVAYGVAPGDGMNVPKRPDAFWVYDFNGRNWITLAAPGSATDVAFTCYSSTQPSSVGIQVATAGDLDLDGRAEIVAVPEGTYGRFIWVMRYGGAPGHWSHVTPAGQVLDADIDLPLPGPTAHALIGSVSSINRPDLLLSRAEWTSGAGPADVNRFTEWRYEPPSDFGDAYFAELASADAATARLPADLAILADVDGDGRAELIVLTHQGRGVGRRDAGWVLDRDTAGVWTHLTPILGHPLEADFEWTVGGVWPAWSLAAADVDGDGRDELVLSSGDSNEIWVLDLDPTTGHWHHLSPVIPPLASQKYALAAYQALVLHAGCSFAELRQAVSAGAEERSALAERLGISIEGKRPDVLDALVLDPSVVRLEELEELFGLVSTRRDPLSQGPVGGPTADQMPRWRLDDARWSADPVCASADQEGLVHIRADRIAQDRATVVAYRDAACTAPVALGEGPSDGVVPLREVFGSGLAGTVCLALRDNSASITVRAFPVLAVHRWRRLREQWDDEDVPDDPFRLGGPSDAVERRPIVDPAVIGPDDFRLPLPKAGSAVPDGPFDLWLRRRTWLDGIVGALRGVGEDMPALLDSMRPLGGAPSADHPWAKAPSDLEFLRSAIIGGASDAAAAAADVLATLYLPVDAFLRLLELRDLAGFGDLRAEDWVEARSILALAHRRSRFNNWCKEERAASVRLDAATFVASARPVTEGTWPPEPLPVDRLPPGGVLPLVDPDRVSADDLPRSVAGTEARLLWARRVTALAGNASVIIAARPAGWEQQLVIALGVVPGTATAWSVWVSDRAAELEHPDSVVVEAAVAAIRASLGGLGVAAFRRLAAVTRTFTDGLVPANEAWADAERSLAVARKVTILYPAWRAEENVPQRKLPYWKVLRFTLTRWLAPTEERQAWLAGLAARCRPAVVDPDMVPLTSIRTGSEAGLSCAAEQRRTERLAALYEREQALRGLLAVSATTSELQRVDIALLAGLWTEVERAAVYADLAARRTAASPQTVVDQVFGPDATRLGGLRADLDVGDQRAAAARRTVLGELGFSSEAAFRDLTDLLAAAGPATPAQLSAFDQTMTAVSLVSWLTRAERGADLLGLRIRDVLAPMRLDPAAWRHLLAVRALAQTGGPLLDVETDALVDILIRCGKERLVGAWQAGEREVAAADVVRLGPDSFTLPEETWAPAKPTSWRVRPADARAWRATLRSRTEQHDGVLVALREAVARVEEVTLPAYRDDLLAALPVASTNPDAGKRWVSDHLLVDTAESGVRRTARVAHAIDTMLALIWSVRTGQLRDTYPDLGLDAPTFDDDWRWIGSYATWRSAILVHLYPENLLRPTLRRYQSPGLSAALDDLRGARQLSPSHARRIVARYAEYFADICRLDQQLIQCTKVRTAYTPVLLVPGNRAPRTCELYATTSTASRRVYWALRDLSPEAASTDLGLSFWHRLDQFGAREITGLIGMVPYEPLGDPGRKRWLYLFAQRQELQGQTVVFLRYDLDTASWDGEPTPLDPPPDVREFTAWLFPTQPWEQPKIGFEYIVQQGDQQQTVRRVRSLNAKGTGWDRADFASLGGYGAWQQIGDAFADYSVGGIDARAVLSADIDGDGRDELVVVPTTDQPPVVMRFDGTTWSQLPRPTTSIPPDAFVAVGRFTRGDPAERQDEIVWIRPSGGPATLLRFTGTWSVIGGTTGWQPALGIRHVVAGDFDGDGYAELAVSSTWGLSGVTLTGTSAFFILGATPAGLVPKTAVGGIDSGTVDHRSSLEVSLGAAFRCSPTTAVPGFILAGDFDGDGRDEIAAAIAPVTAEISQGNDLWVMDLRHATNRWAPLGPVINTNPEWPLHTVMDLNSGNLFLLGAVAGDFDGDGRDEIAVIPVVDTPDTGTSLIILDFQPGPKPTDPAVRGGWRTRSNLDLSWDIVAAGQVVTGDFDGDGADEVAVIGAGRLWLRKYDLAADVWIELPGAGLNGPGGPTSFAFGCVGNLTGQPGTPRTPRRGGRRKYTPDELVLQPGHLEFRIPAIGGSSPTLQRSIRGVAETRNLLARRFARATMRSRGCTPVGPTAPNYADGFGWVLDDTITPRRQALRSLTALTANLGAPSSVVRCLEEAFYDLPIAVSLALQASHDYEHALDWLRLVYDYSQPRNRRKVYFGLTVDEHGITEDAAVDPAAYARDLLAWVRDPLDPHATATIRPHTYTRGTLQLLIRCLLDHADTEFTRDTPESVGRARVLYETARDLLDEPVLRQRLGGCDAVIVRIPSGAGSAPTGVVARMQLALGQVADRVAATVAAHEIAGALDDGADTADEETLRRVLAAEWIVTTALAGHQLPATLGSSLSAARSPHSGRPRTLMSALGTATATALTELTAHSIVPLALPVPYAPRISGASFCVSPNPMLTALRLHVELNLFKLRTGRNIAGMRRTLDVYAAPTDQSSGLPMIGADGELVLPGLRSPVPTPYRYTALIEQARVLGGGARDAEAMMLAALEKRDVEALNLLRARQEVRVVRASVQLQELRVRQAEDRVVVAQLQQARATFEEERYADLVASGPLQYEREALSLLGQAAGLQLAASIASFAAAAVSAVGVFLPDISAAARIQALSGAASSTAAGLSALAGNASTWSQWNTMQAGYVRTKQAWQFQQQLARFDRTIAGAQVAIETDGVRVAEQERRISEIQADSAEQLLEFQQTKFTNVDLYDWMAEVLERTYRWYLQQATSMAQLAAAQLAFERQEGQPPSIQADYWEPPAQGFAILGEGAGPDRRGVTGAERLLQDIAELEQYAFTTDRRKQQLTRTISLAGLDPLGLARLRNDGVVTFTTPTRLFDEDFPGHHLRLIRRVSLSVLALVPPSEGIRATLSTTGTSRVVVGPDVFQTIVLRREPESLSLTGAIGANGLFAFEPPNGLRDPFEGLGVDTTWELRIARPANPFDFSSIADVLLTLDYTAIDSADLRARVIRELDRTREGERGFSLRGDFPDTWWDLMNPNAVDAPLNVSFATTLTDFPTNLEELEITHLAISLVTLSEPPAPLSTISLRFTLDGATTRLGGAATPVDRVVSTRRSNGGPWLPITGKPPFGRWHLQIADTEDVREWITDGQLTDVLLVVSYRGRTPAWPG